MVCLAAGLAVVNTHGGNLAVDNLTVGSATSGTGNATGVLPTKGASYVIVEQLQTDTDTQRGAKLQAAYTKAKGMGPSGTKRITVLIPPGEYDLGTAGITLDTQYIDLIGMVPAQMTERIRSVPPGWFLYWGFPFRSAITWEMVPPRCGLILKGSGPAVIRQTAPNVRIANMIVDHPPQTAGLAYWPDSGLLGVAVEHVRFQCNNPNKHTMPGGIKFSGYYKDCVADDMDDQSPCAFGGDGEANGVFEDCFCMGRYVFGGGRGSATGTFRNCTGGTGSFGGDVASGFFENCVGCYDSFAGSANVSGPRGLLSGTFINCAAGCSSFGGQDGFVDPSAVLVHCSGGYGSFAQLIPNHGSDFINRQDFNYNTNTSHIFQNMDLHNSFITNGVYYGNGSRLVVYPQGDLSMGTFTQ